MYKRQRSQSATRGQLSDFSLGKRKLVDLLFFFFKVKGKLSRYIFMTLKKD